MFWQINITKCLLLILSIYFDAKSDDIDKNLDGRITVQELHEALRRGKQERCFNVFLKFENV